MYKINRWGAAFLLLAGMACWVCSPLGARAPEKMRANSGQIGQFSREGEYVKDYFVIKKGRTFHLFYNVGVANDTQDWQEPDSEKAFTPLRPIWCIGSITRASSELFPVRGRGRSYPLHPS